MRRNILLIIQILTYAQLAYSAIVTDTTVDDRREYFQHGGFSNFVYLLTSTKEKHKLVLAIKFFYSFLFNPSHG